MSLSSKAMPMVKVVPRGFTGKSHSVISTSKILILQMAPPILSTIRSQVIYSKQPNLRLTQESLRMVTARVLIVLSGSFTSQIEMGPTLT